jgi:pimeloyl-ACP methyl ester carboxylesterase
MKQTLSYKNQNILSYTEFGDKKGYPILIQHGLIASITDDALFDRLIKSGRRLISIARPGYGESSPYLMRNIGEWGEIVSVLVDQLELPHFDVLGISSGAPYSYAIGYSLPDKVRNVYILSGTPALFDDAVLQYWPYPVDRSASMADLQKLAYELFFSYLPPEDRQKDEIRDSMRNDCFGIAQDLKLRCVDWGFALPAMKENVYMRHSRADNSVPFITAEMTSKLLPHCKLDIRENDDHFSKEVLDDFVSAVMLSIGA